jgi:hypothetical protein
MESTLVGGTCGSQLIPFGQFPFPNGADPRSIPCDGPDSAMETLSDLAVCSALELDGAPPA